MATLDELREKKRAYIKAEAQKIVDDMVNSGKTSITDQTCGDYWYGWDAERHASMPQICAELLTMGVRSSSKVNWGVTDWVFTLVG